MSVDPFYTPSDLARELIKKASPGRSHAYIVDFAAGDGQLLRAAHRRWPKAQLVATDIDPGAVSLLHRLNPKWRVGKADFLNPVSRLRCRPIANLRGKISLAVINPPFSYRGGQHWKVSVNGSTINCSLAMAFVLNSLAFLVKGGEILAILPAGSLHSEKDKSAWQILRQLCRCKIFPTNGHRAFRQCSPRTNFVRLALRSCEMSFSSKILKAPHTRRNGEGTLVSIVRGTIPIHSLNGKPAKPIPLIHSTELNGTLNLSRRRVSASEKSMIGPAVLLSRVGQPKRNKISLYLARRPIVLSDCVLALKCRKSSDAKAVQRRLIKEWSTVEKRYGGTCAPYITIGALAELLTGFGLRLHKTV